MTKSKSKHLVLLTAAILWAGLIQAQESVNNAGGDATGSGGTVAYSVGQVTYTTNSEISGSVAQGVQHAFEIFIIGVNESDLDISVIVFPNPTTEYLTLQIDDYKITKLICQLYDMHSKLLISEQIVSRHTQIKMNNLPSATYFVHIINQDSLKVKSFKVIKTQ